MPIIEKIIDTLGDIVSFILALVMVAIIFMGPILAIGIVAKLIVG